MSAYLDIIFSFILGSMVILMILTYNFDMIDSNHVNNIYLSVQQTGFDFKEILAHDLTHAGLGIPDTMSSIVLADSQSIKFRSDIGLDGSINETYYYLGDSGSVNYTENPRDRMLFRQIDNLPAETFPIGITGLRFRYYDESGNETAALSTIRHIEYQLLIESTINYDGVYPGIFIRGRIHPKNIMWN